MPVALALARGAAAGASGGLPGQPLSVLRQAGGDLVVAAGIRSIDMARDAQLAGIVQAAGGYRDAVAAVRIPEQAGAALRAEAAAGTGGRAVPTQLLLSVKFQAVAGDGSVGATVAVKAPALATVANNDALQGCPRRPVTYSAAQATPGSGHGAHSRPAFARPAVAPAQSGAKARTLIPGGILGLNNRLCQ